MTSSSRIVDLDLIPPPAKRLEVDRLQSGPWRNKVIEEVAASPKSEFPLRSLEDFYKACPTYRLPVEIGSFSLDDKGKQVMDRSQLQFFSPPPPNSRLNFDLKVGYDKYVSTKCSVPSDKLNPILRWIALNGDCFRPKMSGPKSPDKELTIKLASVGGGGGGGGGDVDHNGSSEAERRISIGEIAVPTSKSVRPDDLLTNFVTWRGMLTKMLCSPYNKTEPWKVAVTLHNHTIYLCEVETQQARDRQEIETPRMKEMSYWGLKFEHYVTNSKPPGTTTPSATSPKSETVNSERAFCSVVRTRMNTHSIVMAAEVDCCDYVQKVNPPQNYIELKTNRIILTDRNKSSFRTYKLLKWWAQSFLVGIPKIVCGFRDDDGIVKSLQHFKTSTIAHETQNDMALWQPAVCLNFLDELLTWIKSVVVSDGPREVYMVSWESPYTHVSCTKCPPNSKYIFLSDWYVHKRHSSEE